MVEGAAVEVGAVDTTGTATEESPGPNRTARVKPELPECSDSMELGALLWVFARSQGDGLTAQRERRGHSDASSLQASLFLLFAAARGLRTASMVLR